MCYHKFIVKDENVVAEYIKGVRDIFKVSGNYEECESCGEGRFVPRDKKLSIVECTKEDLNVDHT